ncbi:Hypothetical protein SMAX5B_017473 [Scophthalmus maximus]|uniref:Uncharacterized protein n=1 Tax=Scophthalmus maximus TaxID=52904 RepID=A0A2U9CP54_SCOMX|nr:Hypothetical protein SMAX5B_017473 [Scophthalmus maximus]
MEMFFPSFYFERAGRLLLPRGLTRWHSWTQLQAAAGRFRPSCLSSRKAAADPKESKYAVKFGTGSLLNYSRTTGTRAEQIDRNKGRCNNTDEIRTSQRSKNILQNYRCLFLNLDLHHGSHSQWYSDMF